MKVAEIIIHCGSAFNTHALCVGFDSLETATGEFDRLTTLLKRRAERANDLEKVVEVKGITQISCPLNEICSIGLCDFAKSNEQEAGMRDAFPNIFKR